MVWDSARTSPTRPTESRNLLEQVAATISRYNMLAPGARVIVGVSGGPDSVCLLHVLRELNIGVTGVAHVNHKLRGEASEEDERFVAAMAQAAGLEFYRTTANLDGGNLEQAARRARREFFYDLMRPRDLTRRGLADKIALGHTLDDQAETVLFRMLRGSGLAGLAGILPVTAEGLVRPLLGVTRPEVETFLRGRGIPWREDASNREPRFARNRIRHELLPSLKQDWNPRLATALAQLGDLSHEEERWWAAEIASIANELLVVSPGAVEIPVSELARLPHAVARRLIRHAIRQVKGDLHGVQFSHIEYVLELPEAGGRAELPGIHAIRSFDWIRLAVPGDSPVREGPVTVPGQRLTPDGNSMICLEVIRRTRRSVACATLKSDLYLGEIPDRLVLRGWRPGDRYCPVGHANDRKLKELFQRQRVPSWRRPFWPILCLGDKILWARDFGPARECAEYSDSRGQFRLRVTEVQRELPAEG
jgi:tRNA(Ile)-lysidine synthase